jgi:hypothetical protein
MLFTVCCLILSKAFRKNYAFITESPRSTPSDGNGGININSAEAGAECRLEAYSGRMVWQRAAGMHSGHEIMRPVLPGKEEAGGAAWRNLTGCGLGRVSP